MGKALMGLGIIFLLIAIAGAGNYTVYDSTEEIPLPPMGSATGWAPLPIPDIAGIVELEVTASWEGSVYWLGVASIEEAQRCDPDSNTKVSLTCSGNNVDFEIGGPQSEDNTINWLVESGEWYACVGQNGGTLGQTDDLSVDISVDASLTSSAFFTLAGIGLGLMTLGFILKRR
ncbi:MAG: hypothetical protein VX613_01130 [Candidatus Thermoplasmatota archaeon]|nr:hypothetical protein [Candidatus Thermoplasmatota archaeon]MEE3135072.1 hypothetical protein [Candidatus Thermoplasmatota archaeon]